jgi:galactitol-specific phosphotransferase system IIC component
VINLFWVYLTPAANLLLERFGLHMQYVDGGWMTGSAIGFASPVGTFIIPFALAINIILLAVNWTKTLNVDIWNFCISASTGGANLALAKTLTADNSGLCLDGVWPRFRDFGDMGPKTSKRKWGFLHFGASASQPPHPHGAEFG